MQKGSNLADLYFKKPNQASLCMDVFLKGGWIDLPQAY